MTVFNSKKKQAEAAQRAAADAQRAAAEAKRAEAKRAEAQRAETEALQARLDQVAAQNAELEQRLAALVQANAELDHRLGTAGARLVGLEQGVDSIGQQVGDLVAVSKASPPLPPPPLVESDDDDADLNERIEELRAELLALAEQTSVIDSRVTNVSTELSNQLVELSRDIETLNRSEPTGDSSDVAVLDTTELEARIGERLDAAIDDVHTATERLAAEQARYEIRFRADLAELADRLRRPGAS